MNIGSRIEEFRKDLGINSKSKFAKMIDMSLGSYQKYEKNERKPGAEILTKLARLGADINWILTGERVMSKEIEAEFAARLKQMEAEITKLKAEMYDLGRELKEVKQQRDSLQQKILLLEEENKALTETNQALGAQISRVAEINLKYSKGKLKK